MLNILEFPHWNQQQRYNFRERFRFPVACYAEA